jgi:nucleoside-diphosphate-sugar epimerase
MVRALVLGGGGFIGPWVARALQHLGHDAITGARRSGDRVADREDPHAIARLIHDERCDVLIDMIAYEPKSTIALRDALDGVIARYVLVSSADVYRNYGGLHRLENAEPILELLGESSPRRMMRFPYRKNPPRPAYSPDAWMDEYDKIPIEDALAGPGTTIARLPMVYGPRDRHRRFAWIAAPMLAGADTISAPAAWLAWVTTYGHVEDVAHALALCATKPAAAGRIYNCGESPAPHAEWIERFAALIGWKGRVTADERAPIAHQVAALDLRFPLALSTVRIRTELGFVEAVSREAAISSTLEDLAGCRNQADSG